MGQTVVRHVLPDSYTDPKEKRYGGLPEVRFVLPDSFIDIKEKGYGGEPISNGRAADYEPRFHREWLRVNFRASVHNKAESRRGGDYLLESLI